MALMLGGARAGAQDALLNAVSVDRLTAPQTNGPVNQEPDQPHLGPLRYSIGAYASAQIDDNVNLAPVNRQADAILSAGFNSRLSWQATPQTELHLDLGIGYSKYIVNDAYSHLDIAPDTALLWNIYFTDGSLTFFDNFTYTQEVITQGAISGTGQLPRYDNSLGARVTWTPDKWLLTVSYTHENFFSDDPAFSYLSRASEYFFARGGWRFAESTQFGMEGSLSVTAYDEAIQNGNTSYSMGPYADWRITSSLHANVRGGLTLYQFDSTGQAQSVGTLSSYYYGLEVDQQLTDFLSHSLNVQRNVQPGLNLGSDYIVQLSANYNFSWQLTRRVRAGANFTYEHGTQPLPVSGVTVNEIYDRFGAGPALFWQVTDKFSASVAYVYWDRNSNLEGNRYTDNNITLSATYGF